VKNFEMLGRRTGSLEPAYLKRVHSGYCLLFCYLLFYFFSPIYHTYDNIVVHI